MSRAKKPAVPCSKISPVRNPLLQYFLHRLLNLCGTGFIIEAYNVTASPMTKWLPTGWLYFDSVSGQNHAMVHIALCLCHLSLLGWWHTNEASQHRYLIWCNISPKWRWQSHQTVLGLLTSCIAAFVDIHVSQFNIWVLKAAAGENLLPKLCGLQAIWLYQLSRSF